MADDPSGSSAPAKVKVAILGGGPSGLSTAFWLTATPGRQSCARAGCGAMATAFGAPLRGATEFPALGDPATRWRNH
jgi:glycine/D-amino acid oxidase-like deaminating enzyme